MKYKLRDDIVLEKISNIYIFVALRSAWDECPFAVQAAPSLAYIWNLMKKGYEQKEIIYLLVSEKEMNQAQAQKNYDFFIRQASKFHYLSEESDQC